MKKIICAILIMSTICINMINVGATTVITPPKGLGTVHTYTPWDKIKWGYNCKDLINFAKSNNAISNSYGIVTYGDYFAGALTSTYGTVGDMLLVITDEQVVYPVIIADTKNQGDSRCNKWGHQYGKCIVEFEILSAYRKSLYGSSGGYISDILARPIVKIINLGSVYTYQDYFKNVKQACIDNKLYGYQLLTSPYESVLIKKEIDALSFINVYIRPKLNLYTTKFYIKNTNLDGDFINVCLS